MLIRRHLLIFPLAIASLAPTVGEAQMMPFSASGAIEAINPGNVKPAGKSDRFIVEERQVSGRLSGDLSGPFTLTYAANVPIATQSGQLHGTIELAGGAYVASFRARSELGLTPARCSDPDGTLCVSTPDGAFRPGLLVNGSLTFVDSTQGHGLISSWLIPQIGSDGHIQRILAGELTLGGSWNGR